MNEPAHLERTLWLEGAPRFRAAMSADCLMVFPMPTGILRGPAILAGLEAAPRWTDLSMTDIAIAHPAPGVTVLAYRAEARRGSGPPYRALCASTWLRDGDTWRIALHQHTPVPA